MRCGLTGSELRHQRQSLRSFLGPSLPSAESGDGEVDGRDVFRETGSDRQIMDRELDWAEGWLTSTQLGWPRAHSNTLFDYHCCVEPGQFMRDGIKEHSHHSCVWRVFENVTYILA